MRESFLTGCDFLKVMNEMDQLFVKYLLFCRNWYVAVFYLVKRVQWKKALQGLGVHCGF